MCVFELTNIVKSAVENSGRQCSNNLKIKIGGERINIIPNDNIAKPMLAERDNANISEDKIGNEDDIADGNISEDKNDKAETIPHISEDNNGENISDDQNDTANEKISEDKNHTTSENISEES